MPALFVPAPHCYLSNQCCLFVIVIKTADFERQKRINPVISITEGYSRLTDEIESFRFGPEGLRGRGRVTVSSDWSDHPLWMEVLSFQAGSRLRGWSGGHGREEGRKNDVSGFRVSEG